MKVLILLEVILVSGYILFNHGWICEGSEVECEAMRSMDWFIGRYYKEDKDRFSRVVRVKIGFKNYNEFYLTGLSYGYGSDAPNLLDYGSLVLKMKSRDGKELLSVRYPDPREYTVVCEAGAHCPPPRFFEKGEEDLFLPLFGPYFQRGKGVFDTRATAYIELYERKDLPEWAFSEGKTFTDFKPEELLLRIDLSGCIKKFCERYARSGDPCCVGESITSPTVIKGKLVDYHNNPVKDTDIVVNFIRESVNEDCIVNAYTDKDGDYIIERCNDEGSLIEGTYLFQVIPSHKLNLKTESRRITLKKGHTEIVNIVLQPCGTIIGKITDRYGNPITEAWAQASGYLTPQYHVLEEGFYAIPNLESGTYEVRASVKIGQDYIDLTPKKATVELGETTVEL